VRRWRTCFSWHTEDYDLWAINYLHHGAPKQWWCVPQMASSRFQRLCEGFFAGQKEKCRAFLRHKAFLVSPSLIRGAGLPIYRCTQVSFRSSPLRALIYLIPPRYFGPPSFLSNVLPSRHRP
jgi:hypothetical protein